MSSIIGIKRFVDATVEQKRNGSCPWVVTVAFTNDEEGEKAAREFHRAVEDANLFATNPAAWRVKHGCSGPPAATNVASAVE